MNLITIVTPTYNRGKFLPKVYKSLLRQSVQNFEWLIVDDGSSDDTKKIVEKLKSENKIKINYLYKENGGKHTALNLAFKNLKTKLTIILDSDDILTDNATETIEQIHIKYKKTENIFGYCFLRGYTLDEPMTKKYPLDETIANYNDYIINNNIKGDKCEVFYSEILKKYSFDKYEGERFIAEGYLWSYISDKYDMVFINKIIYLSDYLEDGLTKAGRLLRLNNPLGGMRHALEYLKKKYIFKIRFKNALLYTVYAKKAKQKINFKEYKILLLAYIPGTILYHYWNKKYCR